MGICVSTWKNGWSLFDVEKFKRASHCLKFLWLLLVLTAASRYLVHQGAQLRQMVASCSLARFSGALIFILLGRVAVCKIASLAITTSEGNISFKDMFRLYNRTQLGKYIPGGLWHIVGRAAIYTRFGLSAKAAGSALLRENLWLIISSCSFGLMLCGPTLLTRCLGKEVGFIGLLLAICLASALYYLSSLLTQRVLGGRAVTSIDWQLATWFCFGLAFALLLPQGLNPSSLCLAMGTFSLAFGLGLAFPIAPSGIGIREAVIYWFFVGILSPQESIGLAAVSRVLWTLGEFVMAIAAELLVIAYDRD